MKKVVSIIAIIVAVISVCVMGWAIYTIEHMDEIVMEKAFGTNDIYEICRNELTKKEGVDKVAYTKNEDGTVTYFIEFDNDEVESYRFDENMVLIVE